MLTDGISSLNLMKYEHMTSRDEEVKKAKLLSSHPLQCVEPLDLSLLLFLP